MGFVFLMFLSGMEVNVAKVVNSFPRRKLTVDRYLNNPLLVGITIYVITLILAAAVADILSILLFTFTISILEKGVRFEVFLIVSLFALFFVFYRLGKVLNRLPILKRLLNLLSHASAQIRVRGALALILLFVILSQIINAEVILGAFLAGILLSYFVGKSRSSLMMKLDGMGHGFLIPIFFILVGSKIDLGVFMESGGLIVFLIALLVLLFAIKVIPSMIWVRLFGWRNALSGGFLMASRLSLIIAASQVGLNLGVISPALNTSFIILAVITCVVSPLIFNKLNRHSEGGKERIIIIGGGGTGVFLAKHQEGFLMMIKREGEYFVPHGDDYFQTGDEVVAYGRQTALIDFRAKLEGK